MRVILNVRDHDCKYRYLFQEVDVIFNEKIVFYY